jgi:hypothetical protein
MEGKKGAGNKTSPARNNARRKNSISSITRTLPLDVSDDSFIAAVLERSKREEEAYAQLEVDIGRRREGL